MWNVDKLVWRKLIVRINVVMSIKSVCLLISHTNTQVLPL